MALLAWTGERVTLPRPMPSLFQVLAVVLDGWLNRHQQRTRVTETTNVVPGATRSQQHPEGTMT